MRSKKGFTIVELLAVIVILSIIIVLASTASTSILNKGRKNTQEEMRNNLKEAAVTYVVGRFYLEKCSTTFSREVNNNNNISNANNTANSSCVKFVTVGTLKNEGSFEDERGYCKDTDQVLVYKYNDGVNSDYRAFVSDDVCTSK